MNKQDILALIDLSPSVTKEVFSSIVTSQSSSTQGAAKKAAVDALKQITKKESLILSIDKYLGSNSLDVIMAFVSERSMQAKETWKHKLLIAPFMWLWIPACAFVYDLSTERLRQLKEDDASEYYQLGDGVFLAGLYLYLG